MIGVFGGTFDPVHYGHIKPALAVKQALSLSQLRFIPNRVPPHRDPHWLTTEQRLELLQLALEDYAGVCIDHRELEREGPSYMVDTLRSLRVDFPGETLVLIIGMDAFYGISRWYQWQLLFDYCHLVVTMRPGFDQHEIEAHLSAEDYRFLSGRFVSDAQALSKHETGKILLQSVPQLDISSTRIRSELLAANDAADAESDLGQYIPEKVYQRLREMI